MAKATAKRDRSRAKDAKSNEDATEVIDASPSKGLFIDMLVRDIELGAAIGDLADNSVDGARKVLGTKAMEKANAFRGYLLRLTVTADEIALSDNCGGITLDAAREYAFKFGRPRGMKGVERSIGQFGVGMKRAFFKLGRTIDLESVTEQSRFALHLPVDEWEAREEWQFELHDVVEGRSQPKRDIGTRIRITDLLEGVSAEAAEPRFPHELLDELAHLHRDAINNGFELEVNEIRAHAEAFRLLEGSGIAPAYLDYTHQNGSAPVRVRIACGVAESSPGTAGWDVVCNGRTVLRSDQTAVTGWRAGGDLFIPSYHNQFARFRGIVLFDSTDAGRVPWNTTKTRLNQDSEVWREAKRQMVTMMRPVIDFLNALDREKDQEASRSTGPTLAASVGKARSKPVQDLSANAVFKYPSPTKAPRAGRVTFYRPKSELDRALAHLGVSTYRELGESAYEYWAEAEMDE